MEDEAKTREHVQQFAAAIAKAKDQALREALLDLMTPYRFSIVGLDGLALVGERIHFDVSGNPRYQMDGVQVNGAELIV